MRVTLVEPQPCKHGARAEGTTGNLVAVVRRFARSRVQSWEEKVNISVGGIMPQTIRIGILGDFNPEFPSHTTIDESLRHAGRALELEVESQWLPTPSLVGAEGDRRLAGYHGLWAAPASPYQSMEGMLRGIEFARARDWPFVGT
jgi:CTP synthase (UTP-ammonia lyase)